MVKDAVRLLVQAESGGAQGELDVRGALPALGPTHSWRIERLFPDEPLDDDLFVVRRLDDIAVLPKDAFALAYALRAQPRIVEAEPDLPIDQYPRQESEPVGAFASEPTVEDLAWARVAMRVDRALAASAARGVGIVIGHPDTGYTRHAVFGATTQALDLLRDKDFIDDDVDAQDPLAKALVPLTKFPGHGTGTGSVIVGRGPDVIGVAPEATLVPIRAVNSVIQLLDTDVARAVNHARRMDCHVISMSLGGKGLIGLKRAIDRALDAGMLVMAAAGNFWPFVVAPASYSNCIAVAATRRDDQPWDGSARGPKVEISAPGSECYGAAWDLATRTQRISQKHGTSYAVAHTAGAAALWLSHHGRDHLLDRYPGRLMQAAYRSILHDVAHRVPPNWNASKYGPGILDVEKLLAAPLPSPTSLQAVGAFEEPAPTGAGRIAASFSDLSEQDVRARLAAASVTDDAVADGTAAELLYLLMTDPRAAEEFAGEQPGAVGAFGPSWALRVQSSASERLAGALG
jgi:subtilisin family serine protease